MNNNMVLITKEHWKMLLALNTWLTKMTSSDYSNEMDNLAKKDLREIADEVRDICWRTNIVNSELNSLMEEAVKKAI